MSKKEQLLKKYGKTNIELKGKEITVNEAMESWEGRSWIIYNEYVRIEFSEDYGHIIEERNKGSIECSN